MSQNVVVPGFEAGTEVNTITGARVGSWIAYMGAAFPLLSLAGMTMKPEAFTNPNPIGPVLMMVALIALGVAFAFAHQSSPYRKYTILSMSEGSNGYALAEVRYLDGTTRTTHIATEDADGFWKQFGKLAKATVSGK